MVARRKKANRLDWSPAVDKRLREHVVALLETHSLKHWQALMAAMHPGVVMFAEATLRRAMRSRVRLVFQQPGHMVTQLDEQALDVAVLVCADLRKNGFRRLAMFEGLHNDSGAPLRGYIAKITRHTAFRYLRTQVLRPDGGRREVTSEAQAAGPATLERLQAAPAHDTGAQTVRHIVARERDLQLLSDEQRDILALYLGGHSAAEIAELCGRKLDAATARQVIRSAKAKLKYHFGQPETGR